MEHERGAFKVNREMKGSAPLRRLGAVKISVETGLFELGSAAGSRGAMLKT
jgi:hypothetical protein